MKHILLLIVFMGSVVLPLKADHITGGQFYYTYTGKTGDLHTYRFTLMEFMTCNDNREFNSPTIIGVFNRATGARISDVEVRLSRQEDIGGTSNDPCITRAPVICYRVGYWDFSLSLPASADGYLLSAQVTNRVDGINNLQPNYDRIGATYTCEIPGTRSLASAIENNSARFTGSDIVTVCANNNFNYSFAAEDADGDELRYFFSDAYQTVGYSSGRNNVSLPPQPPPYYPVPYGNGYSGSQPLGNNVTINPTTGMITGIAPGTGIYVITVCVQEIRNGIAIATQRKDLQLNITGCTIAAATLLPSYMLCGNSTELVAGNLSNSPLISSYAWEITDNNGNMVYESQQATANHTFAQPGTYTIKLATNRGQQCSDSTTATAFVYPGFEPRIQTRGTCISKPVLFEDRTTSVYGTTNFWDWDFGDAAVQTDFSLQQNTAYQYPYPGRKTVQLIAGNDLGCRDTVTAFVDIVDKPPIGLAFRDTLICPPDALQLRASGQGTFTWSPAVNLSGGNTPTPVVQPPVDTKYYVDLDLDGCENHDSVLVRVVDHVSLSLPSDTVICLGDTVQLRPISNGLIYSWAPQMGLSDAGTSSPLAVPRQSTTFTLTTSISNCRATEDITISTVPYPTANAGPDTLICYGTPATLHASTDGSSYNWQTQGPLDDPRSLHPVARPLSTTPYMFFTYDTRGCPKPGTDTVIVNVLPAIHPFAGNDTAVVIGQPLQLHASGGILYNWSPAIGLSDPNAADPVGLYNTSSSGIRYRVIVQNEAGCTDSAFLQVKVYGTLPTVFVPTAFTPNGDGINDILRPVAAGMSQIVFFRIYTRWGELVYSGTQNRIGWDGRINGRIQSTNVYVWQVKAVDYLGQDFFKTGTATLIR